MRAVATDPAGNAAAVAKTVTLKRKPLRAARPCSRISPANAMSSGMIPLPSIPGPSRIAGIPSNRGSERNAAQPSRPRWPSPGGAWRSTLEPSGVAESLKCSEARRSRPTIASNSSTTPATPSAVRTS